MVPVADEGQLHRSVRKAEMSTKSNQATSGYLLANRVDRTEADRLRREHPDAVVSRNADGTYRVTRSR